MLFIPSILFILAEFFFAFNLLSSLLKLYHCNNHKIKVLARMNRMNLIKNKE